MYTAITDNKEMKRKMFGLNAIQALIELWTTTSQKGIIQLRSVLRLIINLIVQSSFPNWYTFSEVINVSLTGSSSWRCMFELLLILTRRL